MNTNLKALQNKGKCFYSRKTEDRLGVITIHNDWKRPLHGYLLTGDKHGEKKAKRCQSEN